MRRVIALSFLAGLAASAQTQPADSLIVLRSGPAVEIVGEFALELGGDEVYEIGFTDGSTATFRAGQGGTFAAGIAVRPTQASPFGLRATVGYKFMETTASNATIRFNRFPIEGVASFHVTPDLFAGAGYTLHTGIRIDGDDVGPDLDFETTGGPTFEAGWRWFAATATLMTYTDEFGFEYDANAFGVSARFGFPVR